MKSEKYPESLEREFSLKFLGGYKKWVWGTLNRTKLRKWIIKGKKVSIISVFNTKYVIIAK